MRRISVLNFKGGTGKTSLATNLGYALTLRGARVLLVDCDLQANASSILPADRRGPPTLTQVLKREVAFEAAIRSARPGLDVLQADSKLDEAANAIVGSGMTGYYLLANAVDKLTGYNFLFFDHSPSYGPITQTALLASEELIIPVEMAPYAMQGLVDMVKKLTDNMTEMRHKLTITGIVPFKLDMRSAMTPAYLEALRNNFGSRMMSPVRVDETVKRAQAENMTVQEYDPRCRTSEDFAALAITLLPEELTHAQKSQGAVL